MSANGHADVAADAPAAGHASELTRRLETARAERAQLARERARAESERALSEQLESEERALENERAIAAAEAEHGAVGKYIAVVETVYAGAVIVKRPHPTLFRRYQDSAEANSVNLEKLVMPCIVHPDLTTYGRWCDEEPALLGRVGGAVVKLAGFRSEEVSGK